jgi:tetratricopeptide (TPR) repeat protein
MSEALAILREMHGEEHPLFANALSDLGLMIEPTDPLRADSLMRESLRILEATVGARGTTLTVMNNLAGLRRDRGDWAGAAELYERLLELRDGTRGRAYTQYGLGLTRLNQGRRAEAERHLREALGMLTDQFGPQHATVVIASTTLGRCLREQGRLNEAEALLLQVRDEFARGAVLPTSFKADVLEELIRIYETTGRHTDRQRIEEELTALAG